MSLAEEKKLIKEIEQLKTSKKTAAQFMSTEEVSIRTIYLARRYLMPCNMQPMSMVCLLVLMFRVSVPAAWGEGGTVCFLFVL